MSGEDRHTTTVVAPAWRDYAAQGQHHGKIGVQDLGACDDEPGIVQDESDFAASDAAIESMDERTRSASDRGAELSRSMDE